MLLHRLRKKVTTAAAAEVCLSHALTIRSELLEAELTRGEKLQRPFLKKDRSSL
jgi:hypothetical protein